MYKSESVRVGESRFGGKGLFVQENKNEGEDVLRVPKSYFLDYDSMMDRHESLKGVSTDKRLQFSCCLVLEMADQDSPYRSYFDSLPRSYHNPISMPESQYQLLQHQPFIDRLLLKRHKILEQFPKLQPLLPLNTSIEDILHCYALVESRTLYYPTPLDPKSEVGVLVPLYDMANHAEEVNNCNIYNLFFYDNRTSEYVLKASRDYSAGEEISISYGAYNNEHFVEYYGFIPHGNPNSLEIVVEWNKVRLDRDNWRQALTVVGVEYPEEVVRGNKPNLRERSVLYVQPDGSIGNSQLLKLLCLKKLPTKSSAVKEIIVEYRKMGDDFYNPDEYSDILAQIYKLLTSQDPSTLEEDREQLET